MYRTVKYTKWYWVTPGSFPVLKYYVRIQRIRGPTFLFFISVQDVTYIIKNNIPKKWSQDAQVPETKEKRYATLIYELCNFSIW